MQYRQKTCFTNWFYIMFQSMIEILTLYNDLFSSLGVDLKIVLELRNKERIFNNSLTRQITHTHKNRLIWNVVKCPISHASEPDYCYKNYDLKMVIKHVNYENTKRVTLIYKSISLLMLLIYQYLFKWGSCIHHSLHGWPMRQSHYYKKATIPCLVRGMKHQITLRNDVEWVPQWLVTEVLEINIRKLI